MLFLYALEPSPCSICIIVSLIFTELPMSGREPEDRLSGYSSILVFLVNGKFFHLYLKPVRWKNKLDLDLGTGNRNKVFK